MTGSNGLLAIEFSCDVSYSHLWVDAFPGMEWSRSLPESAGVRSKSSSAQRETRSVSRPHGEVGSLGKSEVNGCTFPKAGASCNGSLRVRRAR